MVFCVSNNSWSFLFVSSALYPISNSALPCSSYPITRLGAISAILLEIERYSEYCSLVKSTFSENLLTPSDNSKNLS